MDEGSALPHDEHRICRRSRIGGELGALSLEGFLCLGEKRGGRLGEVESQGLFHLTGYIGILESADEARVEGRSPGVENRLLPRVAGRGEANLGAGCDHRTCRVVEGPGGGGGDRLQLLAGRIRDAEVAGQDLPRVRALSVEEGFEPLARQLRALERIDEGGEGYGAIVGARGLVADRDSRIAVVGDRDDDRVLAPAGEIDGCLDRAVLGEDVADYADGSFAWAAQSIFEPSTIRKNPSLSGSRSSMAFAVISAREGSL
jgi:hypothetical protein